MSKSISRKPRVAILGGFGFIGSHLADYLLQCGYEVTVFGRNSQAKQTESIPGLNHVAGDFLNIEDVQGAVANAEIVFHLIGSTVPNSSEKNHLYDVETNLIPSIQLFELCRAIPVRQIIFASSGGTVYGIPDSLPIKETHPTRPISSYGAVKLAIEHYLHLESRITDKSYTVLRLSNPFGPRQPIHKRQGVIGTFVHNAVSGESLKVWGDGSVVRDYIHVDDLVRAMELVIDRVKGYSVYNIGSGKGRSVMDVIQALESVMGKKPEVEYLPAQTVDVPANILDTELFQRDFKWKCEKDFNQGLAELIAWNKGLS